MRRLKGAFAEINRAAARLIGSQDNILRTVTFSGELSYSKHFRFTADVFRVCGNFLNISNVLRRKH